MNPTLQGSASQPRKGLARRIVGNTGIGLIGSLILVGGTLVRTVLIARELNIDTFGLVVICTNFTAFLKLIFRIGVAPTLLRFVPEFLQTDNRDAVGSMLWLALYVSLAAAAVILVLVQTCAGWVAVSWYEHPELADSIRLAAWMGAFFLVGESIASILRLRDQFHLTLIPGIVGSVVSVAVAWMMVRGGHLDLPNAVLAIALADGAALVCAVALWLLVGRDWMRLSRAEILLKPLRENFGKIRQTIAQVSILGVLQTGSEIGGTFLLGILGTPPQVAIMGMAVQLTRPLKVLQGNLGNAVTPEVHRLHAEGAYMRLKRFVDRYALGALAIILGGTAIAWPLATWLIPLLLRPDYAPAVPVFFVLALSGALMIPFQPFFAIAIARGEVGRRNLVTLLRLVYLAIAALVGLTAMGVALSQLLGCLSVRVLNDWPLYQRLKKRSLEDGAPV